MFFERAKQLTKSEQVVLSFIPENKFFSLSDAYLAAEKKLVKHYLSEILGGLVKKRELVRVKKGFFYSGSPSNAFFEYEFGSGLCGGKGYAAFSTALRYHGLLDERPTTYFFATQDKYRKTVFNGTEYVLVGLSKNFYGYVQEKKFKVSTVPKTFFDCFLKPRYAGGLPKVLDCFKRASAGFTANDWRELLYYFENSGNESLKQKTGFLLERFVAGTPKFFLSGLLKSITNKSVVALLEPRGGKHALNKKWMVYY